METPLVAQTTERLRVLLLQPDLARDNRLPPEQILSTRLGISRPVLRKALATLKEEGLIESRRGSGTYLRRSRDSLTTPPYAPPESLADLEDCLRFRMVIECSCAAEAARNRTDAALEAIRGAVQAMKTKVAGDDDVFETDMAFHLAVARAAGNRYPALTLHYLMPSIRMCVQLGRQLRSVPSSISSRRVAGEHEAILHAIADGDADEAARQMRDHLNAGIERIFGRRPW